MILVLWTLISAYRLYLVAKSGDHFFLGGVGRGRGVSDPL
jgi:hypothetical protein